MSAIAGALERKVWIVFNKSIAYANMYIVLSGGPGIGKSQAIKQTTQFLRDIKGIYVAPKSVSRASLTDVMVDSKREIVRLGNDPPLIEFNSLTVCASELGVFMPAYDGEFMSTLNSFWDCEHYDERKRHMKTGLKIENPQLNMIAGTTPGWLASALPAHAWSEGFTSRLLLIYGSGIKLEDPWGEEKLDDTLRRALLHDLNSIHSLFGKMTFEKSMMEDFRLWYLSGQTPVPDHPKLAHYIPRRAFHLIKLCMVISASRSSSLIVSKDDYEEAKAMLLEVEDKIPNIFRDMTSGGDISIIDDVWAEVNRMFVKQQKPVPEGTVLHIIARRGTPAYNVRKMLEVMTDSNMLKIVSAAGPTGRPLYAPVPRALHNPGE